MPDAGCRTERSVRCPPADKCVAEQPQHAPVVQIDRDRVVARQPTIAAVRDHANEEVNGCRMPTCTGSRVATWLRRRVGGSQSWQKQKEHDQSASPRAVDYCSTA